MLKLNLKFLKLNSRGIKRTVTGLFCCISFLGLKAQENSGTTIKVLANFQKNAFPIVDKNKATAILTDANDAAVVNIVSQALSSDIELISDSKPKVLHQPNGDKYMIIAGTIGNSTYIDQLIESKKLDVSSVKNKWESFIIKTVDAPIKGVKKALVIAGSDRRGTAYGLFEISRLMGVSPWVWWADVKPAKRKTLYLTSGTVASNEPSVQYRGIFLNDEDWGLNPWAAKNMDTDIKDIGPKTYAKVFELLLRLRANFIWPAMHKVTKAFYHYPENPVIADKYAIVIGGSHCEPMLRSNIFEWTENFKNEYGVKPGSWRYDTNKSQIYRYWDDRVKESQNYESVYTVGMRGIHDSGMPGPKDKDGKISLLNKVLEDQRNIFKQHFGNPAAVPQIFCPYKEVLGLYQAGLNLPEDITLAWPDDNFGYIRQLSTPAEQKRSGGSGVYYHLSYYGKPHDYLWLSTISPSLISYEMTKAYQFNAKKLWLVNVGDIKPNEMETEFFLDLAWDVNKWKPENAANYAQEWASKIFGNQLAPDIAKIKNEFFLLSQNAKPEHLRMLKFDNEEKTERIDKYNELLNLVVKTKKSVPDYLQSAYFELIEYPVKGAAFMNEKIFYAEMSLDSNVNPEIRVQYAKKAKTAFEEIKQITEYYNKTLEIGKWDGMMSYKPRNLPVFGMPPVLGDNVTETKNKYIDSVGGTFIASKMGVISIPASNFKTKKDITGEEIKVFDGLGLGGKSISRYPSTGLSFNDSDFTKAPYVEYTVNVKTGNYNLSLKCLPTQAIHADRNLKLAVSVNNSPVQIIDVNHPEEDKIWEANLLRGYSEAVFSVKINRQENTKVRVYLMDTGLVFSRLDVTVDDK